MQGAGLILHTSLHVSIVTGIDESSPVKKSKGYAGEAHVRAPRPAELLL
jgi:hypothetical protein